MEIIKRSVIEERETNNDKEGREQIDNENFVDVDAEENLVYGVYVEENDQQNGGFVVEDDVLEQCFSTFLI